MLLTKLIGGLLMPVPVVLGLLVLGLLLFVATRYRRLGGLALLGGTALLFALSLPQLPEVLLDSLESRYPPLVDPPPAQWIVVLGGGANQRPDLPAVSQLSDSSRARLMEGIRLHRLLPDARMTVSGASFGQAITSAQAMAEAAVSLGVPAESIEIFTEPRTTAEEAQAIAARLEPGATAILVTSAYHMRRAVALFEARGLHVMPAPAGHWFDPARSEQHIGSQLPQAQYLLYAEKALWEYLGLLWAGVRGAR